MKTIKDYIAELEHIDALLMRGPNHKGRPWIPEEALEKRAMLLKQKLERLIEVNK
jgi:hypothetical protein